jgi:hypothetical protein
VEPCRRLRCAVRIASALVALLASGCARSCKNDHPYVPYAVGDGAPSTSASATAAVSSSSAPSEPDLGHGEPALVAPPNASTWSVEGMDLVAPEGKELVLAIVRDFDGDGRKDALAVVRPPAPKDKPGEVGPAEVVFYDGAPKDPQSLAVAPAPRAEPGCAPVARLERVGPKSAFVEVGATCASGPASRALYVVRLAKRAAVDFDLAVVDPPGAPKLTLDVDGADRDKDGIDDVALRVTIEGGQPPFEPGPKLSAKLAFFDRPAGASRDSDEPDASLRAIASQVTAKAGRLKEAPQVPGIVAQMRMLYRAMCEEGGAPRLVKLRGGGGIRCGTSKPLEDAGVAEVKALALQGDAIRALAEAEIAQSPPATKTAAKTKELEAALGQVAPFVQPRSVKNLAVAVTAARGPHPEWGPVAFEPSGKLLVRTGSRVSRVDPESGEESDANVAQWSTQVLSPDGKSRWLESYHACEGVAVRATFAPTGADGEVRDVLLPVAPTLGTRCSGTRGELATSIPIAWASRGLEAIVGGVPLLVRPEQGQASLLASHLDEAPPPGSPRSPNGKNLAVPVKGGVLLKTPGKNVRIQSADLEPYAELRHCTVNDDATMIACTKKGRALVAALYRE